MRVFLSYRRDDSSGHAGRLNDALVQRFGLKSVFQDVAAIGPGQDFTDSIQRALEDCDAVLVVIGPNWLAAGVSADQSRLEDPDDYVRLELMTALSRDIPVVPVLVEGANLPTATQLPNVIAPIAQRQAVVLHDATWHQDVEGLVRSLRGEPAVPVRRRRWFAAGVAALAVVAVVGVAGLMLWGGGDESSADEPPPSCDTPREPEWNPFPKPYPEPSVVIDAPNGPLKYAVTDGHYRQLPDSGEWEIVLSTVLTNMQPEVIRHEEWRYDALEVSTFPIDEPSCFFSDVVVLDPDQSSRAHVGFKTDVEPNGQVRLIVGNETLGRLTLVSS